MNSVPEEIKELTKIVPHPMSLNPPPAIGDVPPVLVREHQVVGAHRRWRPRRAARQEQEARLAAYVTD
jgi:hypothetical protein